MAAFVNKHLDTPEKIRSAVDAGLALFNVLDNDYVCAYNDSGSVYGDHVTPNNIEQYLADPSFTEDIAEFDIQRINGQSIVDSPESLEERGERTDGVLTTVELFADMAAEAGWFIGNRETVEAAWRSREHGPGWKHREISLESTGERWQPRIIKAVSDGKEAFTPVLDPVGGEDLLALEGEGGIASFDSYSDAESALMLLSAAAAQPVGYAASVETSGIGMDPVWRAAQEADPWADSSLPDRVARELNMLVEALAAENEGYGLTGASPSVLGAEYAGALAGIIRDRLDPSYGEVLMEVFEDFDAGDELPAAMAKALFENELAHARADFELMDERWRERSLDCLVDYAYEAAEEHPRVDEGRTAPAQDAPEGAVKAVSFSDRGTPTVSWSKEDNEEIVSIPFDLVRSTGMLKSTHEWTLYVSADTKSVLGADVIEHGRWESYTAEEARETLAEAIGGEAHLDAYIVGKCATVTAGDPARAEGPEGAHLWPDIGTVRIANYASAPVCMAVSMTDEAGEPLCDLTVNLGPDIGNGTVMPPCCAFVDVNNVPWAEEWLRETGAAEPYRRFGEAVTAQSGFVEYPLYEFDTAKLAELGAKGMEEYEAAYREAFYKARDEAVRAPGLDSILATAHQSALADRGAANEPVAEREGDAR